MAHTSGQIQDESVAGVVLNSSQLALMVVMQCCGFNSRCWPPLPGQDLARQAGEHSVCAV